MVQEVVRALRKAGAKADATCGIHIHVGLAAHPGKPAAAGQSGQRQGGPADTGAGHLARAARPLVQAGGTRSSSPSSTAASPTPWRRWHSFGTAPTTAAGTRTGGGTPLPTTTKPLPPAQPARGLLHRAARAHHRVPRLQRHTPRGRDQKLHPALPGHQPSGADHQRPPARRGPRRTTPSTPSAAGSCAWGSSGTNSRPRACT